MMYYKTSFTYPVFNHYNGSRRNMVGRFLPKKLDFNILLTKNIITLNNPSPNQKKKKPKIIKKKKTKKSIQ